MTYEQLAGLFIRPLCKILQMTNVVDLTGQEQIREAPVLLKCHPIMTSCGLYQALKETPCVLWIALMLFGELLSVQMKGRLLLLPPNRNHPLPVGSW